MKRSLLLIFLFCLPLYFFAEELSARHIAAAAVAKASVQESVAYVKTALNDMSAGTEKRAVHTFLGGLQEALSQYDEAHRSYAAAAGMSGGDAVGMVKKSNAQLILDAARCALCAGDYKTADAYLAAAAQNSSDPATEAQIKLYRQWSKLSHAEAETEIADAVAAMKSYLELQQMKALKPSLLFTLWYLTGDEKYAAALDKEFPKSAEAALASGRVHLLPSPFWYFIPHKETAKSSRPAESQATLHDAAAKTAEPELEKLPAAKTEEHPLKQQLGLFRDKENADSFIARLKRKGFHAYTQKEVRASGTTYFLVLVDENAEGTIAEQLRTAGFECYPVF